MVSEENANQEVNSQQEKSTPSPGEMLKARREQLGLSQQDIASKLFLKSQQINALECDIIDETASITFTKGYVRNYAKQLGMNSHAVIEAFERFHNQTSVPSSEKLQSFSKRVAKQTHDDRWMMVTYVILLLIVAGVVVWWYQQPNDDAVDDVSLAETIKREAASASVPLNDNASNNNPPTNDLVINESTDSEPVAGLAESEISDLNDGAGDDINSAPSTPVDESNNLTALAEAVQSEGAELPNLAIGTQEGAQPISMVFTFDDDCWVNIKDASGEPIAYGVKQKGRIMEIQGVPPVEVTLGAPDNVRITINGEPVDISSYQNGRTARFALPL
tara:strand:- start:322 stop:1320 length:999 start_codon:yes stop_codon:yes gene_type:complete